MKSHFTADDQKAPALVARLRTFFPQVDTVSDAVEPLVINVVRDDCSKVGRKSQTECAMARACMRQEGYDGAIIRPNVAYLISGTHATRYGVPGSVSREIIIFDRHGDFLPGEYQLSAISPKDTIEHKLRQRSRPHSGKKTGRNHHRLPRVIHRTEGIRAIKAARED